MLFSIEIQLTICFFEYSVCDICFYINRIESNTNWYNNSNAKKLLKSKYYVFLCVAVINSIILIITVMVGIVLLKLNHYIYDAIINESILFFFYFLFWKLIFMWSACKPGLLEESISEYKNRINSEI